jgi:hypothetical protein
MASRGPVTERKHVLPVFKILLLMLLVAAIAATGLFLYTEWRKGRWGKEGERTVELDGAKIKYTYMREGKMQRVLINEEHATLMKLLTHLRANAGGGRLNEGELFLFKALEQLLPHIPHHARVKIDYEDKAISSSRLYR